MDDRDRVRIEVLSGGVRARRVTLAEGTELTTSAEVLNLIGVDDGDVTSPTTLQAQIREFEPQACMQRCLRLVNYRERSTTQLRDRLTLDGYPESVIESTIERLADLGFVDDARFAGCLVRMRIAGGWGPNRIRADLRTAGVSDDLAAEALSSCGDSDDLDRALVLARRRPPASSRDVARVAAGLLRKGYSADTAWTAARQVYRESAQGR